MTSWVALSGDGQLNGRQMLRDLKVERICPILVCDQPARRMVPTFGSSGEARRFAEKNTPHRYAVGTMQLDPEDVLTLEQEGFELVPTAWHQRCELEVFVLQLEQEVMTYRDGCRRRS